MKALFLDFDGVITTYYSHWRLSLDNIMLIKDIVDKTGCKIIVTSTWKHGARDVEEFVNKNLKRWNVQDNTIEWLATNIHGLTDSMCKSRADEVEKYVNENNIKDYVILDDEGGYHDHQLTRFVQTDFAIGITKREADLCIDILEDKKIWQVLRINYDLKYLWRLACDGYPSNINEILEEYYKRY